MRYDQGWGSRERGHEGFVSGGENHEPPPLNVKRMIDVVVAAVLLAALWPVILILMALVKLTSKGPALYTQVRLGMGGRCFTIYKLRTMGQDSERGTGPTWATAKDSRVTPLGRFLRRAHLDELPQLWNALLGDMSLVGPRPERPEIAGKLEFVVPGFSGRICVRPGITGLAQIQLPADSYVGDVRRKLVYDMYYTRKMGPLLDLQIVAGTALKVLGLPFGAIRTALFLPTSRVVSGNVDLAISEHDQRTLPQLLEAV